MLTEKEIRIKIEKLYRSNLFSGLDLLQILKVLAGIKRSTRLIYEKDKSTEKRNFLLDQLEIPYKHITSTVFAGIKDRNKGSWSNLCSKSKKAISIALYIGLHSKDVEKSIKAEECGDDGEFGDVLSYPACCNKFFFDNFGDAANIQGDLFPFVYKNTDDNFSPLPHLLNPLWYFDAGFIEYWPCSFRCIHALEEANIGRNLLKKYLPEIANEMEKKLKSPVLYTEFSGIFCFLDSCYNKNLGILKYDSQKILFTARTKLLNFLQSGDMLRYQSGYWQIFKGNKKIHKITNSFASVAFFDDTEVSGENSMFKIIKQFQSLGLKLPGTTELEILMLLAGKKRALRLIVNADEYEKSLTLAKLLQLEFHVSSKRVSIVSTPGTGDEYVDYVSDAPEDSKYLICFAKEKKDAEYCAKFETMSTDESKLSLNKFLNYPLCCVTSFLERTPHEDWIGPFLRNTPITTWYPVWTNRLGYLFTGTMPLYDYEPCSAFCKDSLDLAKAIKETFKENNIEFLLQQIVDQSSDPVFLHDGVLIMMSNAEAKKTSTGAEIFYDSANFCLKDYKLKPGVENSPFWESDKMIVDGKNITLYRNNTIIQQLKQTQYNNRIFLFEE